MRIDQTLKKKLRDLLINKIQEEQRQTVIIQTPYPLSPEDHELFYKKFPVLKQFQVQTQVNPELIGGFIIRHGSKIIDASVATEITNLSTKLLQN